MHQRIGGGKAGVSGAIDTRGAMGSSIGGKIDMGGVMARTTNSTIKTDGTLSPLP